MPKQYTAMRDKFKKTMGKKAAEKKAARIYNSLGKGHVGRGSK
jgi:hypothetical protein